MTREERTKAYHERANHEDNLLVSRTSLFIGFNGFLAVAVNLAKDDTLTKVVFAFLVFVVDIAWRFWAPRARTFIRALRDRGFARADEELYVEVLGREGRGSRSDVLSILTAYIPLLLAGGWAVLLTHFSFGEAHLADVLWRGWSRLTTGWS